MGFNLGFKGLSTVTTAAKQWQGEMQRSQVRDFGKGVRLAGGFVHHQMAKVIFPPYLLLFVPSIFSGGFESK